MQKDKLIGKTIEFLDENGLLHYGVVKRRCRISIGSKKDKSTEKRTKRSTVKGWVVEQGFKKLGLGHTKEYRITEQQIRTVKFRQRFYSLDEFRKMEE